MDLEIKWLFLTEVTNRGVVGLIPPASSSLLNGTFESVGAVLTPFAHMKCMQNCLQGDKFPTYF